MESFAKPLRALHEDASWFARATEVELLHVRCDAALRSSALKVLQAMEAHAANKSPYVVLEEPWKVADRGWERRAQRLCAHWEERRRVTAEEAGIELGALPDYASSSEDPLGDFGRWLHRVVGALSAPLSGVVVVLAPTQIEDGEAFEAELRELVVQRELREVRWVVLELGEASLERLHEELGAAAMHSECVRDEGGLAQDLTALMRALDPARPRPSKGAWPAVVPPRRASDPAPTPEQSEAVELELVASGVRPALAGAEGQRLEQYLLAAAVAMKAGDGALAIQHQREACRIAHEAGGQRELLLMWMVLAGYELALGHEGEAARQFGEVAAQADRDGFALERAQAGLALGLLAGRRGRHAEASKEYALAADAARAAKATGLAIECWRLSGHMIAEAGVAERAAECWQRAIDLAEESEGSVARSSSAPRAARELAAMLRGRGMSAQATALEHQANRLEAGETRAEAS